MLKTLALVALLLVQATQTPQEPPQKPELYPGQHEHREPPKDWLCHAPTPDNLNPPNPCNCERMCDDMTGQVVEDKKCESWCWPRSCACEISNRMACKQ